MNINYILFSLTAIFHFANQITFSIIFFSPFFLSFLDLTQIRMRLNKNFKKNKYNIYKYFIFKLINQIKVKHFFSFAFNRLLRTQLNQVDPKLSTNIVIKIKYILISDDGYTSNSLVLVDLNFHPE